jgi:O-antigen ligase
MSITAALCSALTVPLWVMGRNFNVLRTPLLFPTLGWLAALVLSATWAVDSASSWPRIAKGFFPALVPLAAWHARTPERGRRAVAVLLAASGVAWLVSIGLYLAGGEGWPARARGLSGHYMTFAGQLAILGPVALGVALLGRGRWRAMATVTAVVGAACLAATFTRSAWLGAAAAVVVMLAWVRPRAILVVAALGALALAFAPGPWAERLRSIADPTHATNVERTRMWRAGLRMFLDRPWTGVGLMDLKPIYERYRDPEARERAGHLHSVPIHVAATMGVAGLAAWVALYAGLAWCAVAGLREGLRRARAPDASDAARLGAGVRLGALGALVAFAISGLFEWNLGDEELLYPLYVVAGIAWAARAWGAPDEVAATPARR